MSSNDVVAQQHDLFRLISRAWENLRKLGSDNLTKGVVRSRLAQLEKNWTAFEDNHAKLRPLLSKDLKEDSYVVENVYDLCEEKYLQNTSHFFDLLDELRQSSSQSSDHSKVFESQLLSRSNVSSLPKITLPKFSGRYQEWVAFRDMFKSIIVDNSGLTKVEKLHHLKLNVVGDAAKLISNIPVTEENFDRTWKRLEERYNNNRALANALLDSSFSLKPIQRKSARDLELLKSTVGEVLEALDALGGQVEHWSMFVVHFVCQRLDSETHESWKLHLGKRTDIPDFSELESFLEGRIRALEAMDARSSPSVKPRPSGGNSASKTVNTARVSTSPSNPCSCCGGPHFVSTCPVYSEKTPEDRKELLISKNLCFNCLGGHRARDCRVQKRCNVCGQAHHTTIHPRSLPPRPQTQNSSPGPNTSTSQRSGSATSEPTPETPAAAGVYHSVTPAPGLSSVLLPTSLIEVISPEGRFTSARALLDQGSELSFVTESLAQSLQLERRRSTLVLFGIGARECTTTRGTVSLQFQQRNDPSEQFCVDAFILPKLTAAIPSHWVEEQSWDHLSGLPLADPNYRKPALVDVLLRANVYGRLLLADIRRGSADSPVAQLTKLGWIVSGPTAPMESAVVSVPNILTCSCDQDLVNTVSDFWRQENIPPPACGVRSEEDLRCEESFVSGHSRTPEGRYIVRLPFKTTPKNFGNSRSIASRVLENMHRRFCRDSKLSEMYVDFMIEYISLKHMQLADDDPNEHSFFLPHHGVLRETSTTTKLRVVFNGSQKTDRGSSLNDHLLAGPKVQTDMMDILLRWRLHAYVSRYFTYGRKSRKPKFSAEGINSL